MRKRDLVVEVYFAVFLQEVYQGVEASPLIQGRSNKILILMTAQRVVEAEVGASHVNLININDLCLGPRIVMIGPCILIHPINQQGLTYRQDQIGHLEVKQVDQIIVDASHNHEVLAHARKTIR